MNHRCLLLALSLAAMPALAREQTGSPALPLDAPSAAAPASDGDSLPAAAGAEKLVGPAEASADIDPDPWEGFNRGVFRFNDRLDRYALKPVAKGYKKVTPRLVRTGITNFFANLRMPIVLLNDLLQGKVRAAGSDGARLVVNTTLGLAGFVDASTRFGIARNDEDFGQTLGVWGVSAGRYLVLPLLGPSSARDGVGFAVDVGTNPATYLLTDEANVAVNVFKVVNMRANLLEVEDIVQGDRYLFFRDLYLQSREFAVKDGRVESDPFLDGDEEFDEPGAAAEGPASGSGTGGEEAASEPAEAGADAAAGPVQDSPAGPDRVDANAEISPSE